ncbi:MAG: GNAT family N-acetyltransferase [Promethearchaeota archaeon]
MIEVNRYDPRQDKAALKELFDDFIQNTAYFSCEWKKFEEELNKRVLDLQYRNSMVIAKENGNAVGWGTFTKFRDYLGNDRVLIHQVLVKKEDAFKKGIEEAIINELESYIKNTLNMTKAYYICPDSDSKKRSLFMKLGMKKSKLFWYEKDL